MRSRLASRASSKRRFQIEIGERLVVLGAPAEHVGERGALVRVRDDDEVQQLKVAARRRLLGQRDALLDHLALHGAGEVEASPDRTRRAEQFVVGEVGRGHTSAPLRLAGVP